MRRLALPWTILQYFLASPTLLHLVSHDQRVQSPLSSPYWSLRWCAQQQSYFKNLSTRQIDCQICHAKPSPPCAKVKWWSDKRMPGHANYSRLSSWSKWGSYCSRQTSCIAALLTLALLNQDRMVSIFFQQLAISTGLHGWITLNRLQRALFNLFQQLVGLGDPRDAFGTWNWRSQVEKWQTWLAKALSCQFFKEVVNPFKAAPPQLNHLSSGTSSTSLWTSPARLMISAHLKFKEPMV